MLRTVILMAIMLGLSACVSRQEVIYTPASSSESSLHRRSMNEVAAMAQALGVYSAQAGEEKTYETAQAAVRDLLKDPGSAQFKDLRIVEYGDGKVVCGRVNAKNSYGGYVGFRMFVAGVKRAMIYRSSEYSSIESEANAGLIDACKYWASDLS